KTEVLEQGVESEFLLDAEVVVPHGGGEFRVPWGRGRLAGEPGERRERWRRRHRGLVGLVVVPPRSPVHSLMHCLGDPDAAPVEIAVVAERRTADREQFQQPPPGSGGLATYANQRLTPGAQFVGGGRAHHRVLAYPHPGCAQWLVMTAKLTERKHSWLSHLTARRQRPPQGRARVAGQAEAECQRRQLIEVNPDDGPRGAAGVGSSLRRERQAPQRTDRRQHERADPASAVPGGSVAAALGGGPSARGAA